MVDIYRVLVLLSIIGRTSSQRIYCTNHSQRIYCTRSFIIPPDCTNHRWKLELPINKYPGTDLKLVGSYPGTFKKYLQIRIFF